MSDKLRAVLLGCGLCWFALLISYMAVMLGLGPITWLSTGNTWFALSRGGAGGAVVGLIVGLIAYRHQQWLLPFAVGMVVVIAWAFLLFLYTAAMAAV